MQSVCESQRASLAAYTKIFINCSLKAEKNSERSGPELNYKNSICSFNDVKDVEWSTSTTLLYQSQDSGRNLTHGKGHFDQST